MNRRGYRGLAWVASNVPLDLVIVSRAHFNSKGRHFHGFADLANCDVLFLPKNDRCFYCDSIADAIIARHVAVTFRLFNEFPARRPRRTWDLQSLENSPISRMSISPIQKP